MNKLDLGAFRVEHVPCEPFLIVCPKSPKQEKELFSDFTEDIEAGVKRARQLSERDGVGLTHVFGEVGRSTTHVYILSPWILKRPT